jgi:redox-sensitive bicupin YhaK (pirin superfamily)
MIAIRRSAERGRTEIDWLDSRHSFSFAHYHDPAHMGFRALRVINDDRIAPGAGFPTHGHRDMEILTWVLAGALSHADSLGTGSTITPGEAQVMSAGTGIRHSEFNASETEPVHLLQIWMLPARAGLRPRYDQKRFPVAEQPGRLHLIGAGAARDGAVLIQQDVDLWAGRLRRGDLVRHALAPGRHAWIHVATGAATVNGRSLVAGDALAASDVPALEIDGAEDGQVLLFDLA